MLPERTVQERGWEVDRRLPVNYDGCEKIVYPVRRNGLLCVAKIYRNVNASSGERIDKVAKSRHEFMSYLATSRSVLSGYVPTPIEMIQDDKGKDNGLLVAWRDGEELSDLYRQVYVPKYHVEALRETLLELPKQLWLNPDSLSEANICWDGSGLWFAEPKLMGYKSKDQWASVVNFEMKNLLENYCK